MHWLENFKSLIVAASKLYVQSVPSRSAAALAYRGIFSLAPLLLVALLLTSMFVGQETAEEEIREIVDTVLDEESAEVVEESVKLMYWGTERDLTLASLVGLGILLYGASALFRETKVALHSVWGLPPNPKTGVRAYLISQTISIVMVFVIALFVLSLIVINIGISYLIPQIGQAGPIAAELFGWLNSVLFMALLFAVLFRLVPDVTLPWADLWVGALVTAVLMMVGIRGIGFYFSISGGGMTAAATGAVVVLLLGSYIAAHIFLIGASFAGAYAQKFGSGKTIQQLAQFDVTLSDP